VGASGQDNGKGAAYLFKLLNGQWTLETKFLPSIPGANYSFGNTVALDNGIAVVGSTSDSNEYSRGGSVYVYRYNESNGSWSQTHRLVPSDHTFESSFGTSVAVQNNRILVGSLGRNIGGSGSNFWSGRAYIYDYNAASKSWVESIVYNPEPTADDYFGRSVALDGDTALVSGTHGVSYPYPSPGQAYVFVLKSGVWVMQQELLPNVGVEDKANFGYGLALKGDVAVVSAVSADYNGVDSGVSYVFRRDGSNWTQEQVLTATDTDAGDNFGLGVVSLSNMTLAIGAYSNAANTSISLVISRIITFNSPIKSAFC